MHSHAVAKMIWERMQYLHLSPQGCALFTLLFRTFSDHTEVLSFTEESSWPVVSQRVQRCDDHYLRLNSYKPNYMLTDLRKTSLPPKVETVDSHRFQPTLDYLTASGLLIRFRRPRELL